MRRITYYFAVLVLIFVCNFNFVQGQVLVDSLYLSSKGQVIGGEFDTLGGWTAKNWNDLIRYDLKKYYIKGRLNLNVRNFDPNTQSSDIRHHILAFYADSIGDHNHWTYNIGDTTVLEDPNHWSYTTDDSVEKSVWNLHTGTNYRGGFKFLSIAGKKIQTYVYDYFWDLNKNYHFSVVWDKNNVQFFIDSVLIVQNNHWQNLALRYLFVGRDYTHSVDYDTGLPNNEYPPHVGPIYSNLVVYGDSLVPEIFPNDTINVALNLPSNLADIASFGIHVRYDTQLVAFDSIEKNPNEPNLVLVYNDDDGILKIVAYSNYNITQRDEILTLKFLPIPDTTEVRFAHLSFDQFNIDQDNLPYLCQTYIIHPLDSLNTVPVELSSFRASLIEQNSVLLKWRTESEQNNYGFEIQRSKNMGGFKSIGFNKGSGTSSSSREYQFIDKNLAEGEYRYRLKQIDFGGSFRISEVTVIQIGIPQEFNLSSNYPNPFNEKTQFQFVIPSRFSNSLVLYQIYDLNGRLVKTVEKKKMKAGKHFLSWDGLNHTGRKMSTGVYFGVMKIGGWKASQKILLIR